MFLTKLTIKIFTIITAEFIKSVVPKTLNMKNQYSACVWGRVGGGVPLVLMI